MSGWICSYRKIWEHPIFAGCAWRVGVWDWMLKKAAWKDTKFVANGKLIDLKRGQLCVSQEQICRETGVSRQALRTFLKLLESEHAIAREAANGATKGRCIITICKYEIYQADERATNQGGNQTSTKHQPTKEQGNKGTTVEEAKASLSASADERAAVALFNDYAERQGWPQVRKLSRQRSVALRARLREAEGLDGWKAALNRAAASDHCNGLNDRGWVCNFDFLTRQSSFAKLMEGNFDNRAKHLPKGRDNGRPSAADIAADIGREFAARAMDSGGYSDPSQPLLPAGPSRRPDEGCAHGLGDGPCDMFAGSDYPRLRIVSP